jgi:hypothetical protein
MAAWERYGFCFVYSRACRGDTNTPNARACAGCLIACVTLDRVTYLVVCDVDLLDHFCGNALKYASKCERARYELYGGVELFLQKKSVLPRQRRNGYLLE